MCNSVATIPRGGMRSLQKYLAKRLQKPEPELLKAWRRLKSTGQQRARARAKGERCGNASSCLMRMLAIYGGAGAGADAPSQKKKNSDFGMVVQAQTLLQE